MTARDEDWLRNSAFDANPPPGDTPQQRLFAVHEGRFFNVHTSSPEFTSPVFLDGWSQRSIWGLEDGRFFLTLWDDRTAADADPDLWVSVADQHPMVCAGHVLLTLMDRTRVDPVAASASLQILAPPPAVDPAPAIADAARRELRALDDLPPSEFTRGAAETYEWILGEPVAGPASDHHYPTTAPDHRHIAAERNVVTGLLYSPFDNERLRQYLNGIDDALTTLLRTALARS